MRATYVLPLVLFAHAAFAGPPVYRCENAGKFTYSDAPCIGAKVVDATPTQGMDKMTGQSRKGKDVQTVEMNALFDKAVQPVTGKTSDEMNVVRHRIKLGAQDQNECSRLDTRLPDLEAAAANSAGAAKGRADVDLYRARKRFFDLKC